MASPPTQVRAAPLYQPQTPLELKAAALDGLALTLLVTGLIAAEGRRAPQGPFGDAGREVGRDMVPKLFDTATVFLIASDLLWPRDGQVLGRIAMIEVLKVLALASRSLP